MGNRFYWRQQCEQAMRESKEQGAGVPHMLLALLLLACSCY